MRSKAGEEPGRGIAEAFAGVTAPCAGTALVIRTAELALAPLRAPAEFARDVAVQFSDEDLFPTLARGVGQTHPGEMEDLVDQNSLKLTPALEHFGIKQDKPLGNGSRGQMRAQRWTDFDSDGTASEER